MLFRSATARDNLGKELGRQLLIYPKALTILSVMLCVLSIVPGLPMLPFLTLAVLTGMLSYSIHRHGTPELALAGGTYTKPGETKAAGAPAGATAKPSEKIESLLTVDTLQIELGYSLVTLADTKKGGDLLERVTGVRRNFAQEMGVLIPPIRLRDNLQLGTNDYRLLLKGNPVAQGKLVPGHWLAMNATNSKTTLKGMPTVEPVFQLPATWVTAMERKNAEMAGYTVVDAPSVMVTHLSETIKQIGRASCRERV